MLPDPSSLFFSGTPALKHEDNKTRDILFYHYDSLIILCFDITIRLACLCLCVCAEAVTNTNLQSCCEPFGLSLLGHSENEMKCLALPLQQKWLKLKFTPLCNQRVRNCQRNCVLAMWVFHSATISPSWWDYYHHPVRAGALLPRVLLLLVLRF